MGNGQPADHVSEIRIPIDIEMARAGGNQRKGLYGDVPLLKAREVDMASAAALEEVALPQERVGVEVGDDQVFVQGFGSGGHMIWRRVEDLVVAGFNDAGKHKPCNDDQDK